MYLPIYDIIQYVECCIFSGVLIQITMQNVLWWLLRIQENSSNKNAPPLNVPDVLIFGKGRFGEAISSQTARNAREGMYCFRVSSQCAKGQLSCYKMLPHFTGIQHWTKTWLYGRCGGMMTLFQTLHMWDFYPKHHCTKTRTWTPSFIFRQRQTEMGTVSFALIHFLSRTHRFITECISS